jgi:hypothetical protein
MKRRQECTGEVTSVARSCDKLLYVLHLAILRSSHFINQLEAIQMLELSMSVWCSHTIIRVIRHSSYVPGPRGCK